MLKIKNYVRPQSIKEAYDLLMQKKSNVIVGGMLWLKMQNRNVHTAIDLQDLGLDQIEETEDSYRIGAMVTLRELELHPGLNALTRNAMADSVRHIVGVQFRNLATVGGSLYGRFGFSDVLTLFLALGAKVDLYKHGLMELEDFCELPRSDRDLLIRVIVPKTSRQTVYLSQRNNSVDFPVLTCALSRTGTELRCAVGARPGKAVCLRGSVQADPEAFAAAAAEQLTFGSNVRAGAVYRSRICSVLIRRGLQTLNRQEV